MRTILSVIFVLLGSCFAQTVPIKSGVVFSGSSVWLSSDYKYGNSNLYLDVPYTDVIEIKAFRDSEFEFNILDQIVYTQQDVWDKVNSMIKLNANEDSITTIFRWVKNNSIIDDNYSDTYPVLANYLNYLNSYPSNECSGLAMFSHNVFNHYFPGRSFIASRIGHVINYMDSAYMDVGYKVLVYEDYYNPASMDTVLGNNRLYYEPIRNTAFTGYEFLLSELEAIASWNRAQSYEVTSTVDNLIMSLPESSTFIFPVRSENIPKKYDDSNMDYYASGIGAFVAGVTGSIEMPFTLLQITGTGSVLLDDTTYTLPNDTLTIKNKLQSYTKYYNSFDIVTNTSGIEAEFLVNARRILLFDTISVTCNVTSGDIGYRTIKTTTPVPTINLTVDKGTATYWTINYDDIHYTNKTIKYPSMTGSVSQDWQDVTFVQSESKPLPISFQNFTDNSTTTITAGTSVLDQCYAAILTPVDTSFTTSLELSFINIDDSDIYYTTDGSTPNATKTLYTIPFTVSTTTTVKWINIKADYANSHVNSRIITKL